MRSMATSQETRKFHSKHKQTEKQVLCCAQNEESEIRGDMETELQCTRDASRLKPFSNDALHGEGEGGCPTQACLWPEWDNGRSPSKPRLPFDGHGHSVAAAEAEGGDSLVHVAADHLVDEGY